MSGGSGDDVFLFRFFTGGVAIDDVITDFEGAGVPGGDQLKFQSFGTGASLSNDGGGLYTVHYGAGSAEQFEVSGVTNIDTGDYVFV
jgi:hypothetical protein